MTLCVITTQANVGLQAQKCQAYYDEPEIGNHA